MSDKGKIEPSLQGREERNRRQEPTPEASLRKDRRLLESLRLSNGKPAAFKWMTRWACQGRCHSTTLICVHVCPCAIGCARDGTTRSLTEFRDRLRTTSVCTPLPRGGPGHATRRRLEAGHESKSQRVTCGKSHQEAQSMRSSPMIATIGKPTENIQITAGMPHCLHRL